MKKDFLTIQGRKRIEQTTETIDELKQSIMTYFEFDGGNFDEFVELNLDTRVLLCVDNLETILRDEQSEFIDFQQSLPRDWKVIVTSRIAVDGATNYPLDVLEGNAAKQFARAYYSTKGISYNLEENELGKITGITGNPLAIRLTIDFIASGNDLPSSLEKVQGNIAEFSYDNLIETLSDDSIKLLEALFVSGKLQRPEMVDLLELSVDEVAKCIKELSRTSLIHRTKGDEEVFFLSDSITDLLLRNPRNIKFRQLLDEKLKKRQIQIRALLRNQDDRNLDKFDDDYVPSSIPEPLQLLTDEVNRALRNNRWRDRVTKCYTKLKAISDYENEASYHFIIGRINSRLKATNNAVESFKLAVALKDRPIFRFHLGRAYYSNHDYENAHKILQPLFEEDYHDPKNSNKDFAPRLLSTYLASLLYSSEFDQMLKVTENYATHPLGLIKGAYRAGTLKRRIENLIAIDTEKERVTSSLSEAIDVLSVSFDEFGFSTKSANEALKLIRELTYIVQHGLDYSDELMKKGLEFIAKYLDDIANESSDSFKTEVQQNVSVLAGFNKTYNPLRSDKWKNLLAAKDAQEMSSLMWEENGYILTTVVRAETARKGFVFAKDNKGETFYIHVKHSLGELYKTFKFIGEGEKLVIKAQRSTHPKNKTREAFEVFKPN